MPTLPGPTPPSSEGGVSKGSTPLPGRSPKGEAGHGALDGGLAGGAAGAGASGIPAAARAVTHRTLDDEERSRVVAALRRARADLVDDTGSRAPDESLEGPVGEGAGAPSGSDRGGRPGIRGKGGGRETTGFGAASGPPVEAGPDARARRIRILLVSGGAVAAVLVAAASLPLLTSGDRSGGRADSVASQAAVSSLPQASSPDSAHPTEHPAHVRGASTPSNSPSAVARPARPATAEPSTATVPAPSGKPTTAKPQPVRSAPPTAGKQVSVHSTYVINVGDRVVNGSSVLSMTSGGKLEVVVNGTVRWSSGPTGAETVFQADGNFVMYDDANYDHAVWSSGTAGHPDAVLVLEANGNVVIQDNGVTLWATNTAS
jgi:hypothetical protein